MTSTDSQEKPGPRAVIFGCAGLSLSPSERSFFTETGPAGFILFQRNCQAPDQVRGLVDAMRDCAGGNDALVLIDQEGGRVARLRPPNWRVPPAGSQFAALYAANPDDARQAAFLNARLIAHELTALGINVDCLPVLDIPVAGADPIIGDRALGQTADQIADLGGAMCDGLMAGGVLPVIKHIPGHGRALVDSHKALPRVDASLAELETTDFAPFRALAHMPLAMTAHVIYNAVDDEAPVTLSAVATLALIREIIGFEGLLLSDDLSMQALSGGLGERGAGAIEAGCDIALHCNGEPDEMEAVAEAVPHLSAPAAMRLQSALDRIQAVNQSQDFDAAAGYARLDEYLGL
ncbi:MAG: beta-N-acetylhexosaminidase [Rhodospirillaceae bacterium]|nr:beta-N-acetylhexosaminidase [Rhodospirillaceae bacterium]